MVENASFTEETGLEVFDLIGNAEFEARRIQGRDDARQVLGLQRLSRAFVENPETILQELVHVAVELCGADSAGISVEREGGTKDNYYHWIAAEGVYAGFLDAMLPQYPSACGICLERGQPQLFRVGKRFFDILGVEAPPVTDGLLLPWHTEDTRGTIYVMAHRRTEAFDRNDLRVMTTLADFAAMAHRHQRQQTKLLQQARRAAAASMADGLAHKINNPLQSLTNLVFLAQQEGDEVGARELAEQLMPDLQRLTGLVSQLLAVPSAAIARYASESATQATQPSL
ncbi:GAF domain-containing protein [Terriglobus roseus]|uniref:histidine kinase n=1 Tax=Terriglobus roseus TaxID=392734 RepID=A0A1H4KBX1_9BACT|nr:GAF domain-containing protein [Terriglobus roseus]SEB55981.1 GAF domain-containing protein [Terriglobus roseus]